MYIAVKTLIFAIYLCIFKTLRQKSASNRNLKGKKTNQIKTKQKTPNQNSWRGFFLIIYSSCTLRGCLAFVLQSAEMATALVIAATIC